MFVTPFSVQLPAGVVEVSVADAKYAGTYDCSVSEESPLRQIALVGTAPKPKPRSFKRRKRDGKNAAGFVDLHEPGGKGDSPLAFFDKSNKKGAE
jgi:hypothetical protein